MHSRDYHLDLPDDIADELIMEEDVEVEDAVTHKKSTQKYRMDVKGLFNVFFLLGIIGGVLFSGYVHLGEFNFLGVHMAGQNVVRDLFLIVMGLLSLKLTPKAFREGNDFNWFPIMEVAKLFAGIFITIIPALAMLRAGEAGHLNFIIKVAEEPWHYFWITGTLSSFLDNAPTYLVFFNTALGKFGQTVQWLMYDAHGMEYLRAVSTGAVFFGAMTYIGNAPNFMVKSICEQSNIRMPSFFGYMMYSVVMLGLIFLAVTFLFF
jgi:Na+/H+ antiporter NhaD/arsenite permease-like protein